MCGVFACKPFVMDWLENSALSQHLGERTVDQNAIHIYENIGGLEVRLDRYTS